MSDYASEFAKTTLGRSLRAARGNASPEAKEYVAKWYGGSGNSRQYIFPILSRMEATDVDVIDIPDIPGKKQGRIVFELSVEEDMCNALNSVHGGCSAALIDICTSLTVSLMAFYVAPKTHSHVSLVLNTTYHSPAPIGSRLKIVCTTVAFGARTMTVKAEIYDKTHGRLVATGMHVKMQPSAPPSPKL
ncbi:HotDog domain-containing protein [Irpex rosettiformis]|uniref:HotDog domain-containing protein n=1 Tax=Irpex rosettiformis TaxID=378272 RepID=A0ACB8UD00_9APHY|nr:HotDog domain-containing protein [Irpex rosettiformis]